MSTPVRVRAVDGIELVADVLGHADDPPVILLHGGGQTRHAWKGTARHIAGQGFRTIAADLRGHGDSGWSPDGVYSLERFVADLRSVAASCRQAPVLIGASLGGITGLLAEGEGPSFLAALVLVDVTPTVRFSGVDRIRQFMRAQGEHGFADVEAAADAVAAYLPHRRRPASPEGLRKNLRLYADGRYRWHWDPALLAFADTLAPEISVRLTAAAGGLRLPVLLVRGGASELVAPEDARRLLELVPGAACIDVANAGHMVAGDLNDEFSSGVLDFLTSRLVPQ